ncbi:hypothetical protein WA026_007773 [Henosepilachna vigintioctopunctata]|uniref:ZP domain-containing protein n=1 Tax=Henosepilachna vigintioctopunctata TaxID=420089 RepID=A0AAW1TYN1_9CUCU
MAHLHHLPYFCLMEVTLACVVFASHQLHLPVVKNEIKSLDVICDANTFNTTVTLEHPFKGMVSAKDFSRNCYTYGTLENTVTLSLPTSGCGLRLTSKVGKNGELLMSYSVFLSIQQDRHLHQIADQEIRVSCQINDEQFSVRSKSMVKEIEHNSMENSRSRSGRMRQDNIWKSQFDENKFRGNTRHQESIKAAKVWMEIVPDEAETSDNSIQDKLQVGESAKLIVKSTLPVDIGWKVVDCNAHDGLGDSSQKLLDEEGCPIDDQLIPQPSYGPIRKVSLTRYQEATSIFPAFKFPDRDRLHLTCMIVLCRGPCKQVNCNKNLSSNEREGKTLNKEDSEDTLDQIKIFNSVEVLAPTVNEYYKTKDYKIHKA